MWHCRVHDGCHEDLEEKRDGTSRTLHFFTYFKL